MEIKEIRNQYSEVSASGQIFIDNSYFCESLADKVRPYGEKIDGQTAVPPCVCNVTITHSDRFKRDMLLIHNTEDLAIEAGGIRFTGIRAHGGNTHLNTEGCTCVAFHRVDVDTIYSTAEAPLIEKVRAALDRGEKVTWEYINDDYVPQPH